MPDIELTTVPTETSLADSDELYFNDVSETPDAVNRITWVNALGTALAALRSVFTAASASAAASLQLHEDTDNGSNKITVTAPAAIASDKTITLPDQTGTALVDSGGTLTGVWDAGGATSFEIPNDAAPTVNANGEIALDTTVTDFSHGIIKYYGGEEMAVVALPVAELTTPTNGHVIAYNSTNDEFELVAASGGGVTNSAGSNVITKSDGTNLVASLITDNGTDITVSPPAAGTFILQQAATPSDDILRVLNSAASTLFKITSTGILQGDGSNPTLTLSNASGTTLAYGANSQVVCGGSDVRLIVDGGAVWWNDPGSGVYSWYPEDDGSRNLGYVSKRWKQLIMSEFVETYEMTAPSAPGANGVRIYAEDNGSGKTRLMALFNSGAAQQIAIEP